MPMVLILLVVTLATNSYAEGNPGDKNITLDGYQPKIVELLPGATITIFPRDVISAFILCEAHSHMYNVILSMMKNITHETSKYGKDIGVVSAVDRNLKWYLISNSTTLINVLLHLNYLAEEQPIPGSCNEEFNLKNDPNLKLILHDTVIDVLFQWSNTKNEKGDLPLCEDKGYSSKLEYQIYVKYMEGGDFTEKTYFNVMKHMMGFARVGESTFVKTIQNDGGTRSIANISSYKQQGAVYSVVVRNKESGAEAAYVSVATYACDLQKDGDCEHKDLTKIIVSTIVPVQAFEILAWHFFREDPRNSYKQFVLSVYICVFLAQDVAAFVLSTLGAVLGLLLLLLGHRYFKTEVFLFGFLMFAIVTYQVICLETEISLIGSLSLAGIFGLLGGALLLSFWWNCGIPVISVLFIGLVSGYLVSCMIFYTPFGNLSYWDSPFNYGATFACGVLVIPVIMLYFTRFLNIFSCAIVGSYLVVIALDTYIGGGMRYIVLNAIRHGTDKNYVKVAVTGPFTLNEIATTVVWVVLFLFGLTFQLLRERKKAPFLPCPRQLQNNQDLRTLLRRSTRSTSREREPLIKGDNQDNTQNYGTSQEVTASSAGEGSEEEIMNKPRVL